MLHVAAGHLHHLDHTRLQGRLLDCTMQVTTAEQQDCNKFVFQNGMLQERELEDDNDNDDGDDDDKEHSHRRLKFET